MSTAEKIEKDWDGCHIAELQLEELEDVPEIAYKLGIVPHDWKNATAGIWADSELEEAVPVRGSSFNHTSNGGAGALYLATLVLASTAMCRSVPLCFWKAGNW